MNTSMNNAAAAAAVVIVIAAAAATLRVRIKNQRLACRDTGRPFSSGWVDWLRLLRPCVRDLLQHLVQVDVFFCMRLLRFFETSKAAARFVLVRERVSCGSEKKLRSE